MKKIIISTCIFFPVCALLFSCAFVPVNNQYEKAATLKKGNLEFAGNYTACSISGAGESAGSNNNFGFRAGYGISDKFDLKLRYEHLMPANSFDKGFGGTSKINYFSIVPKLALIPEKLAFLIPLSHYSFKEESDGIENTSSLNSIAPQLIYTFGNINNKADFSMGLKADCLFGNGGGSVLFGTTLGAGFSSDLSKWAIRPELGVSFFGAGAFFSYGLGFQILLPKNKK